MLIYAVSKRDGQWHKAKILGIHYQLMLQQQKPAAQHNDNYFEEYDEELDEDIDEEDDQKIVRKLQVKFIDQQDEEYVGLEDVLFHDNQ